MTLKLDTNMALSYDDVSLIPNYSITGRNTDITAAGGYKWPIIPSPMINVASIRMLRWAVDNNLISIVHRYFDTAKEQFEFALEACTCDVFRLTFAVGSVAKHRDWIDYLLSSGVTKFCIDMAHGHSFQAIETCEYLKSKLYDMPNHVIMVGNISTSEAAIDLAEAGATHIRVGISSGASCRTWLNTGFGLPMITSLIEVRAALNYKYSPKNRALIIADGGIRNGGDISKAIAAGADFVMCGKIFAATNLADGIEYNSKIEFCGSGEVPHYKEYFGMASTKARSATTSQRTDVSVEGAEGLLLYQGDTSEVINKLMNNLKAALGYNGASNLAEHYSKARFRVISTASYSEKLIHLDRIHN